MADHRRFNRISLSGTCLRPKIRAALLRMFETFDWAAVNQLLESPR